MNEWISVKESIPFDTGSSYQVVTIAKKRYASNLRNGHISSYEGHGIKSINQDWVVRRWPDNFTHWMPLPEDPQE